MTEYHQELSFVTVIGEDRKGIIAKMSQLVYDRGINIEDISQKVVDGKFIMNVVIDVAELEGKIGNLREDLQELIGLTQTLSTDHCFKGNKQFLILKFQLL